MTAKGGCQLTSVNSESLRKLAQKAEEIGAKRYAEAYRILAERLDKLDAEWVTEKEGKP